jgi:hypothetical protein
MKLEDSRLSVQIQSRLQYSLTVLLWGYSNQRCRAQLRAKLYSRLQNDLWNQLEVQLNNPSVRMNLLDFFQ